MVLTREARGSLRATQGSPPAGRAPGTEPEASPWKGRAEPLAATTPYRRGLDAGSPACLSRRLASITHPSKRTRTAWQSQRDWSVQNGAESEPIDAELLGAQLTTSGR